MPCIKPKWAWRAQTPNKNGKHEIRFQWRKDREPDFRIPCGKCPGCIADKKRDWGIRIYHEASLHERNCFVTLSYGVAPERINREDPQKFIKRLRHHYGSKIRYFLTGEYGEKTRRPHYHAILFGEDFRGGAYDINSREYGNVLLDRVWKHGHVHIGEVTPSSAMYTAGYVGKKIGDKDTFSIMSRNPPLGFDWVQEHKDNLRRLNQVVIEGQEWPIPKVYLNWLDGLETFEHLRQERADAVKPKTDRQLDAKELNYLARQKMKEEKI